MDKQLDIRGDKVADVLLAEGKRDARPARRGAADPDPGSQRI